MGVLFANVTTRLPIIVIQHLHSVRMRCSLYLL